MMMFQKPFEKGDILSFKVSSGEEIISRLHEAGDMSKDSYVLIKPIILMPSQNGLGMIPAVLSADKDAIVTLNKNTVVLVAKTNKDVADEYIKATTSIVKPPSGLII